MSNFQKTLIVKTYKTYQVKQCLVKVLKVN